LENNSKTYRLKKAVIFLKQLTHVGFAHYPNLPNFAMLLLVEIILSFIRWWHLSLKLLYS